MTKKKSLTEVDPLEDTRCPEHTKKYLLEKGYKPYRKESGKISWVNDSNRIYKSIKENRKYRLYNTDRFGHRRLKKWIRLSLYLLFIAVMLYLMIYGYLYSAF